MSAKELRRVPLIRQVRENRITQRESGMMLRLTYRQIRRLLGRVKEEDDQGLVHRGQGKPSNRRIAEPIKVKALQLHHVQYGDFGPTVAAEKLAGTAPQSRFGRALQELGVELIVAHLLQAKGRVWWLFQTVRDRLIKAMRLAGISTLGGRESLLGRLPAAP